MLYGKLELSPVLVMRRRNLDLLIRQLTIFFKAHLQLEKRAQDSHPTAGVLKSQ